MKANIPLIIIRTKWDGEPEKNQNKKKNDMPDSSDFRSMSMQTSGFDGMTGLHNNPPHIEFNRFGGPH
jgi:hypothetical protein